MKNKINCINEIKNKNSITKEHLKNLDKFIQKCLDKFKFVEPKKELYEATGENKNLIISHKSTIPDLVIWNKNFNKNKCFIGSDTSNINNFPRFLFYIKIKKNHKSKYNDKDNLTNKSESNSDCNDCSSKESQKNLIIINKNDNINQTKEKFGNIQNCMQKNENSVSDKMLLSKDIKNINITLYLIELYLYKNGWIILINDNFSGPGTSLNLFQFFQDEIKENIDLNNFKIIDINKQVEYGGGFFYKLLSNVLPNLLLKRKMDYMNFDKRKNFPYTIAGYNNINYMNNKYPVNTGIFMPMKENSNFLSNAKNTPNDIKNNNFSSHY